MGMEAAADRSILLIHGVACSSHEFDINYEDCSLVRALARGGYAVWRLDIAGFGQSEAVEDDFQRTAAGDFDYRVTDPVVIEMLCSGSWHYDGESSPNGGRRDICVDEAQSLDLKKIGVPTLVICGGRGPYLNYDRVSAVPDDLPAGTAPEVIEGASRVAFIEKPCHRNFQDRRLRFLNDGSAMQ